MAHKIPHEATSHPKNLLLDELKNYFVERGEKPFRAAQLFKWWHKKGESRFDEMSDLAKSLRESLESELRESFLDLVKTANSKDGSIKFVFETIDGKHIESVYIPETERNTLCLSSQIGCPLECGFCKTGSMGFIRNLAAVEIIEQAYRAEKYLIETKKITLSNLVFMGMGEPLLNYENVIRAAKILLDPAGRDFSNRHMTISTAGIIPGIKKLAEDLPKIGLAVSLNAPDSETRAKIMPLEKKYPITALIKALKSYPLERGRMITVEYVLIEGVNDSLESANKLAALLKSLRVKINLIALNETGEGGYKRPSNNAVHRFKERLIERGYTVMLRSSKGGDVSAACGMLGGEKP